jgi:RNA polymerase sigma-70 factor (ECF subfamily)
VKGFSKITSSIGKEGSMDDKTIISLLRNNPQKGMRMMIEMYHRLVGAVICRVLSGYEEDIKECIDDTFLAVWKKSDILDTAKGSLKSFITTTARNTAISRYRKLKKENVIIPLDDDLADIRSIYGESEIDNFINNDSLQELIADLPEPSREMIIRRYFYRETVKEIANHFLLDEKQVENRLYQAKTRLKKQILERSC